MSRSNPPAVVTMTKIHQANSDQQRFENAASCVSLHPCSWRTQYLRYFLGSAQPRFILGLCNILQAHAATENHQAQRITLQYPHLIQHDVPVKSLHPLLLPVSSPLTFILLSCNCSWGKINAENKTLPLHAWEKDLGFPNNQDSNLPFLGELLGHSPSLHVN